MLKKEINMQMTKQDAFAKFGSYLSVRAGEYDVIDENLGSYEEARKNNTVGEDTPYPWYFPNTEEGRAAAGKWAFESRVEYNWSGRYDGIKWRQATLENKWSKLQVFFATMLWRKAFLKKVANYKAETAKLIALNKIDHVDNISFIGLENELELGLILDEGTPVYFVSSNHGEVVMEEFMVTDYSIYGEPGIIWTSDGEQKPTVDISIHNNFGDGSGNRHKGYIANDAKTDGAGYSNQKTFLNKDAALEQARVWAQELADKNAKWL